MLQILTADPRRPPAVAALAGGGAIAMALIGQYLFDLLPCVLCIYQRYAHGASLAFGLAALLIGGGAGRWLTGLAALAFLAGAGVAGFHVGVEQQWWQGFTGCSTPAVGADTDLEQLRAALMATPVVRCDEIPWSLFGISMAGYNLIFSASLGAILLTALADSRNRSQQP